MHKPDACFVSAQGEESIVAQGHGLSHAQFVAASFGAQGPKANSAVHCFAPQEPQHLSGRYDLSFRFGGCPLDKRSC